MTTIEKKQYLLDQLEDMAKRKERRKKREHIATGQRQVPFDYVEPESTPINQWNVVNGTIRTDTELRRYAYKLLAKSLPHALCDSLKDDLLQSAIVDYLSDGGASNIYRYIGRNVRKVKRENIGATRTPISLEHQDSSLGRVRSIELGVMAMARILSLRDSLSPEDRQTYRLIYSGMIKYGTDNQSSMSKPIAYLAKRAGISISQAYRRFERLCRKCRDCTSERTWEATIDIRIDNLTQKFLRIPD